MDKIIADLEALALELESAQQWSWLTIVERIKKALIEATKESNV